MKNILPEIKPPLTPLTIDEVVKVPGVYAEIMKGFPLNSHRILILDERTWLYVDATDCETLNVDCHGDSAFIKTNETVSVVFSPKA